MKHAVATSLKYLHTMLNLVMLVAVIWHNETKFLIIRSGF